MLQNPQKFILPTMPFRRDIAGGCPVGTAIQYSGKPYQDARKDIQLVLTTNNNDLALRVDLVLEQPSKIKIDCIVSQKTSTAVENLVVCPFNERAVLKIVTLQHSFQIFFNDAKVADFVHRVDPALIKSVTISGPMITEEVVITPPIMQPLPSYEQATSPPVELMANMNLGSTQKAPLQQAPTDLPPPPIGILQPTPQVGQIPTTSNAAPTSSAFYFTGGPQGFSNHPYPLPGVFDATYPSQQNAVGRLPAQAPLNSAQPTAPPMTQALPPTAPPAPPAPPVPAAPQQPLRAAAAYAPLPPPPPTSVVQNGYATAPTPSVPYITYPSASSTPAMPQPIPPQNSGNFYQNVGAQPGYNPYAGQMPVPQPSSAVVPVAAMQPQVAVQPYPVAAPQTYIYPTSMVQPYPYYQQYPMGYGYGPEVVYYESGYHHHRHHHHHCD